MRREQTDFMRLLFNPEAIAQLAVVTEDMRAAASGVMAMANFRDFAHGSLGVNPREVLENFAQYAKPQFESALMDYRQQSIAGRFFADQKLNWKPHPALAAIIKRIRAEIKAQSEPQQLDTIA